MNINEEVLKAFEIIQQGGIILYPTDTVWGIGCDATNPEAVAKIYKLKQRAETQSMIVLMNGEKMMYNVFKDIPEVAWQIMDLSDPSPASLRDEQAKQKPITLILDKPRNVAPNLIAPDNTLGIRIVKEPFCFKLMEKMKKPLVSTSANISGQPTPKSFKEISPEIIKGVDYVVNLQREKIAGKPSTIIKLTNDSQVKVIRK
ncbi:MULTISPECIES: L-threonylcarbamoyladenylate synthase [unclassified Flavobacterium]|jgi:L-threonylcarbamoyladenylate synthase|uniref:L-threonylcarbamoyladenylate synthase n=3 Tax=Flavobacterium TaxID=237 RepID=UPI0025B8E3DD|nr:MULTISPECIES: L-threonylcarbamoyladenylate synthase [unclassified Flavobacterium]